ncbi:OprO/OprP family phosphate-selective porin, partial [Nitrosomonas nitrosa]|uniref:OprO/OprP family phosphate-selective porin n=2 Tax=Nitrosomonas TaxID=914 RepID=UPI0023F7D58B
PETAPASSAEITSIREELEQKTNAITALEERVKNTEKIKAKYGPGLHFESADGNFTAAVDGRIQVDSQYNITNDVLPATGNALPNELNSGANIRRARLGVEGTIYKDWFYKFEYDFSRGNGAVTSGITDAFLRWHYSEPLSVKIGSFKEPFSLEEATSNRFLTFIERNMIVNTFVDNPNTYKTGIGSNWAEERWQVGVAFQTEPVGSWSTAATSVNPNGNNSRNNGSGDTGWQVIGRISFLPWKESESKFFHIGGSGGHTTVNNQYRANDQFNNGGMSFVAFPGTNVDRTAILNTGNLTTGERGVPGSRRIDSYNRFGAEMALVYGPFSLQGEYIQTDIHGKGYSGESLFGYYGYVSYFLTGESRTYRQETAAWGRIKPTRSFDMKGGWGAWEVAFGYDYINLNDGNVRGGKADTIKFGLNWYPLSHVRLMTNYVHVLNVNTSGVADPRSAGFNNANLDIFETRLQFDF